jgi:hypothetical protein
VQKTKVFKLEKKAVTDTQTKCSKHLNIVRADAKKIYGSFKGRINNLVSNEIDSKVLKSKHGITESHYHGREYNGKGILKLMTHSDTLMTDFHDYLVKMFQKKKSKL